MMHPALRSYLGWAWDVGILPQWSMRKWHLAGANLAGTYLTGANLWRANIAGARWDSRPPPDGWICVDGLLRMDR